MNTKIASAAELAEIADDLWAFLDEQLGVRMPAPGPLDIDPVDKILVLWNEIRSSDPDPSPTVGAYISRPALSAVADAVVEAAS